MTGLIAQRFFAAGIKILLLLAAILLLLGIPIWFYKSYYYMLLRLAVCFISAYCAYRIRSAARWRFWALILLAFPLNPILLNAYFGQAYSSIGLPFDFAVALFFIWMSQKPQINSALVEQEDPSRLRRMILAGCASLAIIVAMASNFRFVSSEDDLTAYDRLIGHLWRPAWFVVELFAGPEFGSLDYLFELMAVSMLIYALVVWGVLSLGVWMQERFFR